MTIDRAMLDGARLEAFAGRLLSSYTESMVTLMIDVGFRPGLLDTRHPVGAENTDRSRDLHIFVEKAAEPVSS